MAAPLAQKRSVVPLLVVESRVPCMTRTTPGWPYWHPLYLEDLMNKNSSSSADALTTQRRCDHESVAGVFCIFVVSAAPCHCTYLSRPLIMLHACAVAAIAIAVAPAKVPTIEIAPGVDMPLVGIGTWQYDSMTAASEVTNALRLGYRHIDTAIGYKNQLGVGHAIHTGIEGLGIPRKEMFVVS